MGMIVDTSVGPAIFIVVGFVLKYIQSVTVTSALSGLKVALIFSNIAKFLLCLTRKNLLKNKTNRIYESGNDPRS